MDLKQILSAFDENLIPVAILLGTYFAVIYLLMTQGYAWAFPPPKADDATKPLKEKTAKLREEHEKLATEAAKFKGIASALGAKLELLMEMKS